METTDFITTDNRQETEEKYASSQKYNYKEFCCCCGRGIKGEPKMWVHLIEPGDVVPANTKDEDIQKTGIRDMGCYPIGSECAKRYDNKFILVANLINPI